MTPVTHIAVLGSTGSIGRSTLEVIQSSKGSLQAVALSAHGRTALLAEQARSVRPRWLIVTDAAKAAEVSWRQDLPPGVELRVGEAGLRQTVTDPEVDVVVAAIVGSAGLLGTWAALEAGKTVALANKETLVMAGPLVMRAGPADAAPADLPVDSEHSAIFQALQAGRREDVRRVVLTASGGPFRGTPPSSWPK